MALRIAPDSRLNAAPHVLAKASSALADRPGTKLCEIPKAPLAIAMPINANIRSAVAQREKESCPSMAMKCSPCPGEPVCGRLSPRTRETTEDRRLEKERDVDGRRGAAQPLWTEDCRRSLHRQKMARSPWELLQRNGRAILTFKFNRGQAARPLRFGGFGPPGEVIRELWERQFQSLSAAAGRGAVRIQGLRDRTYR